MNSLCLAGDGLTATLFASALAPQRQLVLRRDGLLVDYVICGEMWCRPLEYFLPRARAPLVQVAPC